MWLSVYCLALCVAFSQSLSVKRTFRCGSATYLTTNNGVIVSHGGISANHNYGKDIDCLWTIEAPHGQRVELTATSFDIELDPKCHFDSLILYDGDSVNGHEIGKYCGDSFDPVSSTGRFLTLHFVTDEDVQASGFRLFYNFTDAVILSMATYVSLDSRKTVTDSRQPQFIGTCHSNEYECANGRCILNFFLCDGDDDCGDDSDEQNCNASTTSKPVAGCSSNEFQCNNGQCIDATWLCDGDDDCNDNSDETPDKCIMNSGSCGTLNYTGASGSVSSPNYPNNYPSNLVCTYYIEAPAGTKSIEMSFDNHFKVEPDHTCSYDKLYVFSDGQSNKQGPICGYETPGNLTIPGDHAFVRFITDDGQNYLGFRLNYQAIAA